MRISDWSSDVCSSDLNIDVAKRVLSRGPDISPTVARLKITQRTDLARVIYANSITLTPGPVSVDVGHDAILVHALSREGIEGLLKIARAQGRERVCQYVATLVVE